MYTRINTENLHEGAISTVSLDIMSFRGYLNKLGLCNGDLAASTAVKGPNQLTDAY